MRVDTRYAAAAQGDLDRNGLVELVVGRSRISLTDVVAVHWAIGPTPTLTHACVPRRREHRAESPEPVRPGGQTVEFARRGLETQVVDLGGPSVENPRAPGE